MENKKSLENILNQLKEYEKLINLDDSEDINEDFASQINSTLDDLNAEILNAQQLEFSKINIKFINTSNNPDPTFSHEGDSGFDLRAFIPEPILLAPGERMAIPTGLFFELQKGTELQVRPRSGLALKQGITVLNTPGTVDSHYRGEIKIILINLDQNSRFKIENGDRIAQGVIMPVFGEGKVNLLRTDTLNETERGSDGFGSSGIL